MRTNKVMIVALLSALLFSVALAMTASAAPPAQGAAHVQLTRANLKSNGIVRFKPTAQRTPVANAQQLELASRVNRALPKSLQSHLQAPSVALPLVTPTLIDIGPSGALAAKGLNGYDTYAVEGVAFQPPDQGMCAGNGYVVELLNDVVAIYDGNLNKITGDMALDSFFGLAPGTFSSDPKCYYDPQENRFFATMLSATGTTPQDTHVFVNLAVSRTRNPRLDWYEYTLDVSTDNCPVDAQPCLGDQPLLGANRDAIFISTNNFSFFGSFFGGTNMYVLDKTALAAGAIGSLVNVLFAPLGNLPTPDMGALWYTVQPATSPEASQWDNSANGTEWALSALDFFGDGSGDNRVAEWAITHTRDIHGVPGSGLSTIKFSNHIVKSEFYNFPFQPDFEPLVYAKQKDDGLIPYGKHDYGATAAGPIQTNDDRMNQVVYAGKTLWSGVNTALRQRFTTGNETHSGIAWFAVQPGMSGGTLTGKMAKQGYVAPEHEDAVFPSIGVTTGNIGAMVFTLTGKDYYPSGAFVRVSLAGTGPVLISNKGRSSYDGRCEYDLSCGNGVLDPRWGDYSAAVAVGNQVFLSTEYIETRDCTETQWVADGTCGDTRAPHQNWGSSFARITP